VDSYSATFGCAITLAGIPVTGNFAAVSLYNESESTCSSDPNAFLGLSIGTCFPSPFGPNDTNSFSFGCSYSFGGPGVHFYDDNACAEEVDTVHLDPSCEILFNTSINSTVLGYQQYQCISIDVNPVYDDDTGSDDAIPPTGYVYIQYNTGANCDGMATYYEGVALGKCLLLYQDATAVGSVFIECSGDTYTEYIFESLDCSGEASSYSDDYVNTCFTFADDDFYFSSPFGKSYELLCSSDNALPMTETSVVLK